MNRKCRRPASELAERRTRQGNHKYWIERQRSERRATSLEVNAQVEAPTANVDAGAVVVVAAAVITLDAPRGVNATPTVVRIASAVSVATTKVRTTVATAMSSIK